MTPDQAQRIEERLERIAGTIQAFAALEFDARAPVGPEGDTVDAVAAGVNFLGEELEASYREVEQRVAERSAELRRTSELLHATQALARVGGWELDVLDGSLFWTDETYRIHDTSPEEYTPTVETAIRFYAPEAVPRITAAVQDAIEHGTPYDLELELITATGRRIVAHTTCTVTRVQGRTVKITGAFQDITERKRIEAELIASEKLLGVGQLARGIAHDFNNVLAAIRGHGELVRDALPAESGQVRADIEQVLAATERAAGLTRELMSFSRLQVLRPEVLDLAEVVEGATGMLQSILAGRVELSVHATPGLGYVMADRSQLEQVVNNLALNARDSMPDGGRLSVAVRNVEVASSDTAGRPATVPGPYVLLSVSDTGVGMDAQTQARIFEPFFTGRTQGAGTGLGLATVLGIVRQAGGFVDVESEPGRGTTFKVHLPRITSEPVAVASAGTSAAPSASAGRETILLVDDDEVVRLVTRRALERKGYNVLEAGNGAAALSVAAAYPGIIDLLLTDVVMPGLQGHELAARMTAARPGLGVLYISGFTEDQAIHEDVAQGMAAFLQKPFSIDALQGAVRRVLEQRTG